MTTKKFPDYTREEMQETLISCYSALVGIYRLTKPEEVDHLPFHDISDSLPRFQEIYALAKEPLDEMFEREATDTKGCSGCMGGRCDECPTDDAGYAVMVERAKNGA